MKRKIFVLINILGMGLAVALCIVAYLNWDFRKNWDRSQKNKESIYRIQFLRDGQDEIEKYGMAPMPLANHIDKNIVDVATKYISRESDIKIEDELFRTLFSYADSQFFAMFDIELKFGDIRNFKDKVRFS